MENRPLKCKAPDVFFSLASYYHLKPEVLANALIYNLCVHPPKSLTLISRESSWEALAQVSRDCRQKLRLRRNSKGGPD